ncbi:MAG: poly-gamma-glutamate biosynthesis protein PgsC [Clostridiales bacterium]|nr:poly-gamma-glutamate biosynthesis protein PgsC [Clostridiales bacterium]
MLDNIIVLGILVSIIFYEWTEISPGGVIVPGYIALFLDNPKRIITTVMLSILTYATVRLLSKYIVIYGRRKFSVFIIVSFLIRFIIGNFLGVLDFPISTALIIGYLIPGIIALDMDRQGIIKTLSAMFIVAFVLKIVMNMYGA